MLLLVASLALQTSGQSILCVMAHCLPSITQCYLDSECKAVLDCLSKGGNRIENIAILKI